MKNVKLKAAAALLFALAALRGAQASELKITLTNDTDAKVFVAVGATSEGGENDGDFSQGWWGVEPGETKMITIDGYSPVCGYGFYAVSKGGERVWTDKEGNEYWIHPQKTFKIHPDDTLPGGKKVVFRYLSVTDVRRRDEIMDGLAHVVFAMSK